MIARDRRVLKAITVTDRTVPNLSSEITPRYLRVPQAAVYVGLATKTIYRMAEERRIPFIRKGRTLLFDRVALDKWMQLGAVSPLSVWND